MVKIIWACSAKKLEGIRYFASKSSAATALGLSAMLGLSGAIALTEGLNKPAVAQIDTSRVSLFLSRAEGESYNTFLRRAEAIARTGVQQTFDNDALISEAFESAAKASFC